MWLMDLKREVAHLQLLVARVRDDLAAQRQHSLGQMAGIEAEALRRKEDLIRLEARVDRLERPRRDRTQKAIPHA